MHDVYVCILRIRHITLSNLYCCYRFDNESTGCELILISGAGWERLHAWPSAQTQYLLACYRYIELNPVRAQMVHYPADYPS